MSVNYVPNPFMFEDLGITIGQVVPRSAVGYRNMWWSVDHDRTFFGKGDLSMGDLDKIYGWLARPENRRKTFTCWHHWHGSGRQVTTHPMLRMTYAAGITHPAEAYRGMRVALVTE